MGFVPFVPSVPPSARAQELGQRLAEVIREYGRQHSDLSGIEVNQALQIAMGATSGDSERKRALIAIVVALLVGLGLAVALVARAGAGVAAGVPVMVGALILFAIVVMLGYTISERRAYEIRAELERRRGKLGSGATPAAEGSRS